MTMELLKPNNEIRHITRGTMAYDEFGTELPWRTITILYIVPEGKKFKGSICNTVGPTTSHYFQINGQDYPLPTYNSQGVGNSHKLYLEAGDVISYDHGLSQYLLQIALSGVEF